MISNKKDIVDIVKDTLNPYYKEYGLTHDEFKVVAKAAVGKITAATDAEIRKVVMRALAETASATSLTSDGWSHLNAQLNVDGATETAENSAAAPARPDAAVGEASCYVVGDEAITLDSLKAFLTRSQSLSTAAERR